MHGRPWKGNAYGLLGIRHLLIRYNKVTNNNKEERRKMEGIRERQCPRVDKHTLAVWRIAGVWRDTG